MSGSGLWEFLRNRPTEVFDQFYDLFEHSDFSLTTWLSLGAVLHLLVSYWLPPRVSALLPLGWLAYRFIRSAFDMKRLDLTGKNGYNMGINSGRFTTRLQEPTAEKATKTNDGVVMFVLGARYNHPFGKLAPGFADVDIVFKDMFREAEKNRKKWSYLGSSDILFDMSDKQSTTLIFLTYWKDLAGLQAFAECPEHRRGWDAFNKGKYPYMGMMHETYHAPKGHWETIYHDMRPFGMADCKFVPESEDKEGEANGEVKLGDTIIPKPKGSTMFSRMKKQKGQGWDL
ncbi:hypothetical protein P280DRAFT_513737 [Massarina eburnea CBS 473.64]|uniref:DUF4188 domain-containing protein n=1 Tax=Massarina eburnea CBS 473.64 TaxID=1395130 RepID=A0A6A6SFN3_9PLEO|nr:hypothetical protein P280DRAFT_513737 [Massarina eburnea CBS 473.64]